MATIHVAKTGDNINNGSSLALAKLTISGATGGVSALNSGDTLEIHAGTYTDDPLEIHEVPDGIDANNPTIIRNTLNENVIFDGDGGINNEGDLAYFSNANFISVIGSMSNSTDRTGITFRGDGCTQGIMFIGNAGGTDGKCSFITIENVTFTCISDGSINAAIRSNPTIGGTDTGAHNVVIRNCHVHHVGTVPLGTHGIYCQWADSQIDGCEVNDIVGGHGIHQNTENATDPTIHNNNVYSDNTIYNISNSHGLRIGTGSDAWVYNNVIYNCGADGIILGSTGHDIDHNTIYNTNTKNEDWCGIEFEGCNDTRVRNNIIHTSDYGIFLNASSGSIAPNRLENNIIWNCGVNVFDVNPANGNTQNGTINANPMLVNPVVDFHLNSGSPAENAGVGGTGVSTDHDGVLRAALPEIGAFEIVSTVVRSSINTSGSGQAVSINAPPNTSTADGDVMIVAIHSNDDTGHSDNNGATPFTKDLEYLEGSGGATISIWSRRLQPGDPSTYNFTLASSARWTIIAVCFEDPHPDEIYDVLPGGSNGEAATVGTVHSITTQTSFAIHCSVMGVDGDTTPITGWPSGYAVEQSGGSQALAFTTKAIENGGTATGTTQYSWFGSNTFQGVSFAIKNNSADVTIMFGVGAGG